MVGSFGVPAKFTYCPARTPPTQHTHAYTRRLPAAVTPPSRTSPVGSAGGHLLEGVGPEGLSLSCLRCFKWVFVSHIKWSLIKILRKIGKFSLL